ncbi:cytochrome P450 4A10 [Colletotrichum chrysophilum]|uniref:Cytochrome P450 4A10 n=1 Tax=Colletotrichum chrysophilum TaxID=1836956 RepID=A0AAD9AJN2_9PEZI|nr:cytochrome P450 4A10 [Colletotrichum chrysophilum]
MITHALKTFALLLFGSLVLYAGCLSFYNILLHPLKGIPGPFAAKVSRLWLFYWDYSGNPHRHIRDLHAKFGPLVRISPNEVSIDDVKANNIIYSQTNPWLKPHYHYKAFQSSKAYSIFTELDPEVHAAHLRLIAPAFSHARITGVDAQNMLWEKCCLMIEAINRNMGQINSNDEKPKHPQAAEVCLTKMFRSLSLDVVTEWTFGQCANSLKSFHSDLFEVFDVAAESVIFFQHIPFLRRLIPYIAPLVPKLVPNKLLGQYAQQALEATRRRKTEATDSNVDGSVFSNLASEAWQKKRGFKPSDGQIISDGIVILAAGADTTAAALSVGIHHLARRADLWVELQDELKPVMTMCDGCPRLESLAQLPLLNAVLKEGLRISCPIRGHMPRIVPKGGWTYRDTWFPAGSVVATSAYYGCYNHTVFSNPERYDPSRWLIASDTSEMEAHLQPFSRGTRQCIGQNLTLATQRLAIATIVHKFRPTAIRDGMIRTREYVTLLVDSPLTVELSPW